MCQGVEDICLEVSQYFPRTKEISTLSTTSFLAIFFWFEDIQTRIFTQGHKDQWNNYLLDLYTIF